MPTPKFRPNIAYETIKLAEQSYTSPDGVLFSMDDTVYLRGYGTCDETLTYIVDTIYSVYRTDQHGLDMPVVTEVVIKRRLPPIHKDDSILEKAEKEKRYSYEELLNKDNVYVTLSDYSGCTRRNKPHVDIKALEKEKYHDSVL